MLFIVPLLLLLLHYDVLRAIGAQITVYSYFCTSTDA